MNGGRVDGRDVEDLRMLIERLERVVGEVTAREVAGDLDPIARLRKQIGSRTVSRLMEICDDPIPIQGPDLRMAAQGA